MPSPRSDRGRFAVRAPDRGGRPWIGSSICCPTVVGDRSRRFTSSRSPSCSVVWRVCCSGSRCTRRVRAVCFRSGRCSACSTWSSNFFRPIPFVILLAAVQPIARSVGIPGIGNPSSASSRSRSPRCSRSAASWSRTCSRCARHPRGRACSGREPLPHPVPADPARGAGPLILGYTFIVVALVDMTAIAGAVAAGGLGDVRDRLWVQAVQPGRHVGRRAHHHRDRAGRAVPRQCAGPEGAATLIRSAGQNERVALTAAAAQARPPPFRRRGGRVRAPRARRAGCPRRRSGDRSRCRRRGC